MLAPSPIVAPDPDAWEYGVEVPHDPRGASVARATVRAVLDAHGLPELTDCAQLLSSEMVANAYLYSDGEARLRLKWRWGVLRLAVWDNSPRPPHLRCAAEDAEGGRGLYLLEVCADRWGHYPIATSLFGTRSKVIWCELAQRPSAGLDASN